ncbi:MAG: hypothetical protein RL328_2361 [Acidobacteriota bacterium]|jgi:hypothetical protein
MLWASAPAKAATVFAGLPSIDTTTESNLETGVLRVLTIGEVPEHPKVPRDPESSKSTGTWSDVLFSAGTGAAVLVGITGYRRR